MGIFREWLETLVSNTWGKFDEWKFQRDKELTIRDLRGAHDLKQLEFFWSTTPKRVKDDPEVKEVYEGQIRALPSTPTEAAKEEALGWIADQIAKGIWAVTKLSNEALQPIITKLLKDKGVPDEDIEYILKIMGSGEFGLNAVVSFVLGITLYPSISRVLEPTMEVIGYGAWSVSPKRILSPAELVRLKYLDRLGDIDYSAEMRMLGYDDSHQKAKERDYLYYPSATDFIRFAVREVFRPETVKTYGYDEEFPTDIIPYAEKAGVDEETLKWYWRAHWEIPSPTMGYEMLHRGVITKEELETLLKIQDIAPYWVDKLIQISYAPLTRVDARRMYEMGILDDEAFIKANMDLGYTRENAELILRWAKTLKMGPEKDLTKSQILEAYEIDEVTREDAKKYLQHLGYDEDEAELLLLLKEDSMRRKDLKVHIQALQEKYIKGTLNDAELKRKLEELNLTQKQVQREMIIAQLKFDSNIKLPSRSELDRMLKFKLITEAEYDEDMRRLGYLPRHINAYKKMIR